LLKAVLETARPRQWVKNIFVAAPLIFAKRLADVDLLARAGLAAAVFCALSTAVYFWNDLVDLEKDRVHPVKSRRPIASGRLSPNAARIWSLVFAGGGLTVGALILGLDYALAAGGYLVLNVAYSLFLKRVVYLDVLSIAGGFLLRVVAGGAAVHVHVSPFLFICTGLLATYLGFGKRAHELAAAGDRAHAQRAVLRAYDPSLLRIALWATAILTLGAYVMYTLSPHTRAFFGTDRMVLTTPFAAFGLVRFGQLVSRADQHDSPTDLMLRDWPFVANVVAWGAVILALIYLR
jgi:4-hydroxybenzoate polyprenyltransferase